MGEKEIRISQIAIYRVSIQLKKPFIISLGTIREASNILVVVQTDLGITGMGECSPFLSINGESQDTCFVVGQYLASALKGKNPLQIQECVHLMDQIIFGNSSIKSAFDIALHDIASQNAGVPLYRFLGGLEKRDLYTDYTVSLNDIAQMVEDSLAIKEAGFSAIKIKLGGDPDLDVERIREIRKAIGRDLPMRIDANQGWNPGDAARVLVALKDMRIQFCEEPIPRWDFMSLPQVRQCSPIPIMADESCFDVHDAQRLIHIGACDMLNLKLGKSGGLRKARQVIGKAQEAQFKMQVGGFMESRLAMTANAHLALSNPLIEFCDFDTPLMFVSDPISGGIQYEKGGKIRVPDTPGLGAWISQEQLDVYPHVII